MNFEHVNYKRRLAWSSLIYSRHSGNTAIGISDLQLLYKEKKWVSLDFRPPEVNSSAGKPFKCCTFGPNSFPAAPEGQTSIANLHWNIAADLQNRLARLPFPRLIEQFLKPASHHHGSASGINLLNYLGRVCIGGAAGKINHTEIRKSQWVGRHREAEVTWIGLIEGVKADQHQGGKEGDTDGTLRVLSSYASFLFLPIRSSCIVYSALDWLAEPSSLPASKCVPTFLFILPYLLTINNQPLCSALLFFKFCLSVLCNQSMKVGYAYTLTLNISTLSLIIQTLLKVEHCTEPSVYVVKKD